MNHMGIKFKMSECAKHQFINGQLYHSENKLYILLTRKLLKQRFLVD